MSRICLEIVRSLDTISLRALPQHFMCNARPVTLTKLSTPILYRLAGMHSESTLSYTGCSVNKLPLSLSKALTL